ncbi:hypothetical protein DBR06_SOUSAS7610021, partial [Sousa chinensis]
QKPKQPTKPQPPRLCWALPFGQLTGHSPEAEHSVLSLFKSTSSSDHNGNQSQVTTQRRIHGNIKRKDTEMMLQWLQQEKETCSLEWVQGCLGCSQERRGTLAVPEEFGDAITRPREHTTP